MQPKSVRELFLTTRHFWMLSNFVCETECANVYQKLNKSLSCLNVCFIFISRRKFENIKFDSKPNVRYFNNKKKTIDFCDINFNSLIESHALTFLLIRFYILFNICWRMLKNGPIDSSINTMWKGQTGNVTCLCIV